jgi:hypothetical protein
MNEEMIFLHRNGNGVPRGTIECKILSIRDIMLPVPKHATKKIIIRHDNSGCRQRYQEDDGELIFTKKRLAVLFIVV